MSFVAATKNALKSEALEAARMNPATSLRSGQGSALKAIMVNSALCAAKLAGGILGHSYAMVADAAESFTDVVGSSIAFFGLSVAATPADRQHPAGHGRAETLASAVTALALMAIGGLIFWQSLLSLGEPRSTPNPLVLFILIPVILIKEWMFHWLRERGKAIGSVAVMTEAWHQRSDVVTSVAALFGIIAAWIGGPAWNHADSWAAMLASLWLVGVGIWLINPALHELMEGSMDPALLAFIRETGGSCPGVKGIDKVGVRKLGMRLMIDLHVEVEPMISVLEGHRVAHEVKARLQSELPQVLDVMVHVEPYGQDSLPPLRTLPVETAP
jgi:cation diffusion facilitator family transporter